MKLYFRTKSGVTGLTLTDEERVNLKAIYPEIEWSSIPFEKQTNGKLSPVAKPIEISIFGYSWDWIHKKQQGGK